jgi:nucleotide-binding universal stress UspA family protein
VKTRCPNLLAVDGIRTSRTAAPAAAELARALGARVVVLNVREPAGAATASLGPAIEEAAVEYLDNWSKTWRVPASGPSRRSGPLAGAGPRLPSSRQRRNTGRS